MAALKLFVFQNKAILICAFHFKKENKKRTLTTILYSYTAFILFDYFNAKNP